MAREYVRASRVIGNVKNFGGILLFDDASNGMNWDVSGNVANPKCIGADKPALSGGSSLRIFNDNVSAVDDKYVTIKKAFYVINSQIINVEVIFQFKVTDKYKDVVFNVYLNDELRTYKIAIKHVRADLKLQYLNDGETYTDLVATGLGFYPGVWQYLKFGFNKITKKYNDLVINKRLIDMSDIDVFNESGYAGTNCYLEITPKQYSNITNFNMYVDSVLITGD